MRERHMLSKIHTTTINRQSRWFFCFLYVYSAESDNTNQVEVRYPWSYLVKRPRYIDVKYANRSLGMWYKRTLRTLGWSLTGTTTLIVTLMGLSLVMSTIFLCGSSAMLRSLPPFIAWSATIRLLQTFKSMYTVQISVNARKVFKEFLEFNW